MANSSSLSYDAMDILYSEWNGDPVQAPWTADVHLSLGLLLANYFFAVISTSCLVVVRFHVRHRLVRKVGFDDWMLFAAQVSYTIYIVFLITLSLRISIYGMPSQYWPTMLALSFEPLPLGLLSILVRLSVATFFLRALPLFSQPLPRICIIALVSLYSCFMTAHTFINVFQCGDPLSSDAEATNARCISTLVLYAMIRAARILNVVTDWIMTLIPVVLVARSNLQRRDRLTAIIVLVLAGIGSTVSVLGVAFVDMGDIWWPSDVPHSFLFTLISVWENGLVLIALSLATTRPLLKQWWPAKEVEQDHELVAERIQCAWMVDSDQKGSFQVHVSAKLGCETFEV